MVAGTGPVNKRNKHKNKPKDGVPNSYLTTCTVRATWLVTPGSQPKVLSSAASNEPSYSASVFAVLPDMADSQPFPSAQSERSASAVARRAAGAVAHAHLRSHRPRCSSASGDCSRVVLLAATTSPSGASTGGEGGSGGGLGGAGGG